MQRFITLDENNRVVAIRYGDEKLATEIQSDTGELGQIMLEDGTFIDLEPVIEPIPPTIEEQILAEAHYQTALLEIMMLGGNEA